MKSEPKFILSYSTLEHLLEPPVHELWPWNFPFLALFKQPYVINVSFKELNKLSPWTLSVDPKAQEHLMVGHE
jgi:hypothetical protein